jgi:hypothetical protein
MKHGLSIEDQLKEMVNLCHIKYSTFKNLQPFLELTFDTLYERKE